MKCRVAELNVEIKNVYKHLEHVCRDYISDFAAPEITVELTAPLIAAELKRAEVISDEPRFEESLAYRLLADKLPLFDGFVLHSAVMDIDGVGVALAAHSGTGKTTHLRLLAQLLGERLTVINGDKPIVRFLEGEPDTAYAFGTPWNGKEHYGCNKKTPLRHICFVERSKENFVEPLDKDTAISRIFNQVYMPSDPIAAASTIALVDRLFSCCEIWTVHCNMDISAAETTYKALFG